MQGRPRGECTSRGRPSFSMLSPAKVDVGPAILARILRGAGSQGTPRKRVGCHEQFPIDTRVLRLILSIHTEYPAKWQTARKGRTQSHGSKAEKAMIAGLPKGEGLTSRWLSGGLSLFRGGGRRGIMLMAAVQFSTFLRRLRAHEGQSMVEYALIIALVAVVVVGAVVLLGKGISNIFDSITGSL